MLQIKTIRLAVVFTLIVAYVILAICDITNGRYRTGVVSGLFAAVTWLVFF